MGPGALVSMRNAGSIRQSAILVVAAPTRVFPRVGSKFGPTMCSII